MHVKRVPPRTGEPNPILSSLLFREPRRASSRRGTLRPYAFFTTVAVMRGRDRLAATVGLPPVLAGRGVSLLVDAPLAEDAAPVVRSSVRQPLPSELEDLLTRLVALEAGRRASAELEVSQPMLALPSPRP